MGAEIINGDRVAINKNNGKWCAYGLPFAGSSRIYKNVTTPIGTIVILRQSEENSIKRLNKLEAFRYIYSETTINSWHKGFINTIINLILDMLDLSLIHISCAAMVYTETGSYDKVPQYRCEMTNFYQDACKKVLCELES